MHISKNDFVILLKKINHATSVSGAKYRNITIDGDFIIGERVSSKSQFKISITKLYDAYTNLDNYTTGSLKFYVKSESSPALAILMEIGVVKNGEKCIISSGKIHNSSEKDHSFSFKEVLDKQLRNEQEKDEVLQEYIQKNISKNGSNVIESQKEDKKYDPLSQDIIMHEKSGKNISIGCGILIFVIIASGIPAATKGEGPVGSIVISILGIIIAYVLAKKLSGND